MNNPLAVSPSKGNKGTTRGEEKIFFDLGGNRTHDLRIRSTVTLPTEVKKDFFFTSCGSLIPFTRANAQWVIHEFN